MAYGNDRHDPALNELYRAILALKDEEECRDLFNDLFTMREQLSFAQRLQIAKLLMDGETYETVRSKTSASSSTITRINTELQFGSGGYKKILDRLAEEDAAKSSDDPARVKTDKNFE